VKMEGSWENHIKTLTDSKHVDQAAIIDKDKLKLLGGTSGFVPTKEECKDVLAAFTDPQKIRAEGLKVVGGMYVVLQSDDNSIYAKKKAGGITVVKTGQTIIFATYAESTIPGQSTVIVERLASHFRGLNF